MLHTRYASALSYWKTKLLSAMCLVAINMLLRWFNTSIMLSIDMQFTLDEEKLRFLTWRPSCLIPWQIWWSLSVCETGSWTLGPFLGLVWWIHAIVLWMESSL